MHLKNFSLIKYPGTGYSLAPAYDLVASSLVNPMDNEDLALTLNGKKKRIRRNDFLEAFKRANLDEKVVSSLFRKFEKSFSDWGKFIDMSFLPNEMKPEYKKIIKYKAQQIEINTNQTI